MFYSTESKGGGRGAHSLRHHIAMSNTESNDLRIIIYLRKPEISVERISFRCHRKIHEA